MRGFIIILFFLLCIVVGASADALNNKGKQTWGHMLEALEIALVWSVVPIFGLYTFVEYFFSLFTYSLFRGSVFDLIYNLIAGKRWDYLSDRNWWGRFWLHWPGKAILWMRIIAFLSAVSMVFRYLGHINST